MNPLLITAAGLLGSTIVALQTWTLKELYSLRILATRAEERHDALDHRVAKLEGAAR